MSHPHRSTMIGERHYADRTHVDCADGTDHGGADTPGQRSFSRDRMMGSQVPAPPDDVTGSSFSLLQIRAATGLLFG